MYQLCSLRLGPVGRDLRGRSDFAGCHELLDIHSTGFYSSQLVGNHGQNIRRSVARMVMEQETAFKRVSGGELSFAVCMKGRSFSHLEFGRNI